MRNKTVVAAALLSLFAVSVQADTLDRSFVQARRSTLTFRSKHEGSANYVPIVIFETNDIHGAIEPVPANAKTGASASGCAACLATLIKSESRPHLWLDAGDWFQGSPVGNLTKGEAVIAVMNAINPTAALIGNHDYDYGEPVVKKLASEARFPFLGSNIRSDADGSTVGYVRPYIIKKVGGVKIGIFGILTPGMPSLAFADNIKGLQFGQVGDESARMVQLLRKKGAKIVVAVTHLGIESYGGKTFSGLGRGDLALANNVPGIDIILGGHTHTAVDPPVVITAKDGHQTMITQTPAFLKSVYRIVLWVDPKTGRIGKTEAGLVPLDPSAYPPDQDVANLVAGYTKQVAQAMSRPIGSSAQVLQIKFHDQYTRAESSMGEWVTGVLKRYGKTDIGLTNTMGIRDNLPAGPLTYGDVYKVMPFDNRAVTLSMAGSELRKVVEEAIGDDVIFLQYSGLDYTYDPKLPRGQRLKSVTVNGASLDDQKVYTVTTVDFVADVDAAFKAAKKTITGRPNVTLRDLLVEEVEKRSPVAPGPLGHVTAL